MKKILFFVESLSGGGAEKVLFDIVKGLDKSKYEITVKTITDIGVYNEQIKEYCIYESFLSKKLLNGNIFSKLIYKIKYNLIYKLPAKISYNILFRKKFDIEVAFIEGYATKIISNSKNKLSTKISWIHFIPDINNKDYADKSYKSLEEHILSYKVFNKVVCVSKSVYDAAEVKYKISKEKLIIKYNPIDHTNILCKSIEECNLISDKIILTTVGRLVYEKGYDRILKVIKKIKSNIDIDFELLILGEGEQRNELEKYIIKNGLNNTVKLLGFVENPYKYLKNSDLFICSSRTEGYSLVVAEALVLGIPVISTKCSGPSEILNEGKYGLIVDNTERDLYEGIKFLLNNKQMLCELKNKAIEGGKSFNYREIITQIEEEIFN